MYDVAVVGGSLAGAMTAHHLARAGLEVVLVERQRGTQRPKSCGEGLLPAGVRELEEAGLGPALRAASAPFLGVRFHVAGVTATARFAPELSGIGIRRDVLDPLVMELARVSGVEVREGATVTALVVEHGLATVVRTADGDQIRARVIVGADGLGSRVRRLAGLDPRSHSDRYGISKHIILDRFVEPWVDVRFSDSHELYLTPVGDRELNVAVLARKRFMRRFAGDLDDAFSAFLSGHPHVPHAWVASGPSAATGPFGVRTSRSWRGNVILVGDAAGFFDGITGEGMSLALVSARLCAIAVQRHLDTASFGPFRRYHAQRSRLARNSELLGHLTRFAGPRLPLARLAARNLARRPATFDKLLAINAGERSLASLTPRDLLALSLGL